MKTLQWLVVVGWFTVGSLGLAETQPGTPSHGTPSSTYGSQSSYSPTGSLSQEKYLKLMQYLSACTDERPTSRDEDSVRRLLQR